jgi:hypothetical protein
MGRERKRVAFIARTQSGKSTNIREMIEARVKGSEEWCIIYDPNNQKAWWDYPAISLEKAAQLKKGIYRVVNADHKAFLKMISEKKGGIVVFEDASVFLTPQKDQAVYNILVSLRHPDHDIDIVLVGHAVADFPQYITRQLNELLLGKTGDSWKNIEDRFPDSVKEDAQQAFEELLGDPSNYAFKRIIISKTGTL